MEGITSGWIESVMDCRVLQPGGPARRAETDTRKLSEGMCFFALKGERRDGHDFIREAIDRGAKGIIAEEEKIRTMEINAPEGVFVVGVRDPLEALSLMAREWRKLFQARTVAVTGSFGKSTTKEFLKSMLGASGETVASPSSYNNHIGVPLTLLAMDERTEYLVAEIGTSSPGEVRALAETVRPEVGVITGIGPVHLEGLGSPERVAEEKASLFQVLPAHGTAVLDGQGEWASFLKSKARCRTVAIGIDDEEMEISAALLEQGARHTTFSVSGRKITLPVPGVHNVRNFLLALAAASGLGVDQDIALKGIGNFKPLKGRLDFKSFPQGFTVIDDSYNSNPVSARAALDVLRSMPNGSRKIVVLGEMKELGEYAEKEHYSLGGAVAGLGLDLVVTVGKGLPEMIAKGAYAAGMDKSRIITIDSVGNAGVFLKGYLRQGDVILIKASRAVGLEGILRKLDEKEDSHAL